MTANAECCSIPPIQNVIGSGRKLPKSDVLLSSLLNARPVGLFVFERQSTDDALATVLIKMSPWTEAEVAAGEHLFAICNRLDPAHPNTKVIGQLNPKASFLSPVFLSGDLPEDLQKRMEYRVSPCTDDRPYLMAYRWDLIPSNLIPNASLPLHGVHDY